MVGFQEIAGVYSPEQKGLKGLLPEEEVRK